MLNPYGEISRLRSIIKKQDLILDYLITALPPQTDELMEIFKEIQRYRQVSKAQKIFQRKLQEDIKKKK